MFGVHMHFCAYVVGGLGQLTVLVCLCQTKLQQFNLKILIGFISILESSYTCEA
jgi:hypothetical protein